MGTDAEYVKKGNRCYISKVMNGKLCKCKAGVDDALNHVKEDVEYAKWQMLNMQWGVHKCYIYATKAKEIALANKQ